MQKNQDQGRPNETGRNPQQQQDTRSENSSNRPEVENPQPSRKVEEPITGQGGMQAGSGGQGQEQGRGEGQGQTQGKENANMQTNTGGTGNTNTAGASNKDYQRSDAGMQRESGEKQGQMDESRRETTSSENDKKTNR